MPRKSCFNVPGIPQHVIQRGNNREPSSEKPVQNAFPPRINVPGGKHARTQVFNQFVAYYAIDVYTPKAYILR